MIGFVTPGRTNKRFWLPQPGRQEAVLYAFLLLAGGAGTVLLAPLLSSDRHALGPHAVSLFIPFISGLGCLAYLVVTGRYGRWRDWLPGVTFLLLGLLLFRHWFQPIEHYPGDDPWRYSLYAHHILDQLTLWGSDGVYYGADSKAFVDQPGYRYYLAAMTWLCGGENRLMQLCNLGILLSVLVIGVRSLARAGTLEGRLTAAMVLLAGPYAAKSVVQGLSEWLAVSLFILYVVATFRRQDLVAILLLALVPFIRQNLIPIAVVMATWHLVATKKYWLSIPFLLVFSLPLYHNMYFAGEASLLVRNKGAMFRLDGTLSEFYAGTVKVILWKLPNYIGIPSEKIDLHTIIAALLFAPLSLVGIAVSVAKSGMKRGVSRMLVFGIIAGPSILFGHAYFPRFVFTNYMVALLTFSVFAYFEKLPYPKRA